MLTVLTVVWAANHRSVLESPDSSVRHGSDCLSEHGSHCCGYKVRWKYAALMMLRTLHFFSHQWPASLKLRLQEMFLFLSDFSNLSENQSKSCKSKKCNLFWQFLFSSFKQEELCKASKQFNRSTVVFLVIIVVVTCYKNWKSMR